MILCRGSLSCTGLDDVLGVPVGELALGEEPSRLRQGLDLVEFDQGMEPGRLGWDVQGAGAEGLLADVDPGGGGGLLGELPLHPLEVGEVMGGCSLVDLGLRSPCEILRQGVPTVDADPVHGGVSPEGGPGSIHQLLG